MNEDTLSSLVAALVGGGGSASVVLILLKIFVGNAFKEFKETTAAVNAIRTSLAGVDAQLKNLSEQFRELREGHNKLIDLVAAHRVTQSEVKQLQGEVVDLRRQMNGMGQELATLRGQMKE